MMIHIYKCVFNLTQARRCDLSLLELYIYKATLEILNSIIKLAYHTSTMSLIPSLKYDIVTSNRIVSTLFQPILLNKVGEIILSVVSLSTRIICIGYY